jgi:hypothetical protein
VPAKVLGGKRKQPKGMLIYASFRTKIYPIVAATNTIPGKCRGRRSEGIGIELGNSHFVTENS